MNFRNLAILNALGSFSLAVICTFFPNAFTLVNTNLVDDFGQPAFRRHAWDLHT
jgi:hypothetical protein